MIYTTLNRIREHSPCANGWTKLLGHWGKTTADDEPLSLSVVLDSNGLDDALWCLRAEPQHEKIWRLLAVQYAREVQHLMTDQRSLDALDVAEKHAKGAATDAELEAAESAARAAAQGAAWGQARAAAWAAAWAAVWEAAEAAVSAATDAAWATAWAEGRKSWEAARKMQEKALREVLDLYHAEPGGQAMIITKQVTA